MGRMYVRWLEHTHTYTHMHTSMHTRMHMNMHNDPVYRPGSTSTHSARVQVHASRSLDAVGISGLTDAHIDTMIDACGSVQSTLLHVDMVVRRKLRLILL